MNRKVVVWIMAVVVVVTIGVGGIVLQNDTTKSSSEQLKIGAVLPMTSWAAYVGESCKKGIKLAVLEFRKSNPKNEVTVIVEDSANDPKTGLAANRKLRDINNVPIVFYVMSSIAETVLNQAPNDPSLLSVVSYSEITKDRPRTYRYFLSSDKETQAMAKFLTERKATTAAFLYVNDDFGLDAAQCFRRYFEELGGHVIFEESFDKSGNQVNDVVSKSLAAKPDAVYFAGYGAPIALIAKRLRENQYKGLVCSFSSFSASTVLKQAGDAAEGVFISTTGFDPAAPQNSIQNQFVNQYTLNYGSPPDHYAAYCYDLTSIFLKCWRESGHNLEQALKLMSKINSYKGVIGTTRCDKNRDFQFPVFINVVSDGKLQSP